ncbi:MAG: OB-fold nucleic acid binding domain-containing protein, partial [Bacilli bacterium]
NQLTVRRNQQLLFAIKRIKIIKTKNNEEMAFLEIYDDTAIIDAVIFPATYQKYQGILEEKKIYLGLGNLEMRKGKMQYIVNELTRRIQ